tara:strand:+ start:65 stop:631 length:567 start_codon:yes stop_codon:yes gene_type:complete
MKTKYLLLASLFIALSTFGQEFTVTPEGLRDSLDNDKSYVVISTPDKTAEQNYNNAIKYISKIYKNPKEVIKSDIKSEYLRFDTFVSDFLVVNNMGAKISQDAKFTITLSFKDSRVKFEITNLSIYNSAGGKVTFSGSAFSGFPIYNKKKTKLKRPDTKKDIEVYFNNTINNIKNEFLEKTSDSADDW